ncbi:hypothetical protein [Archangium sp.]|uniref:hypothetical protein n=1 Tax=Archangium sp. TaxID=1872627 RepID=UPI002D4C6138|nr:hypothetical protein [Archangium sp.]HYO58190.1 hypothetical protein [Archangium sp.]
MLHALNAQVDSLLEECIREHLSLSRTFHRVLPAVLKETGAQGLAVTTRNEELAEQTFHVGDFGGVFPGALLTGPRGTRREGDGTLVAQELNVMCQTVGRIGLYLAGDHTRPEQAERLERMLDTVAEQLDTVLLVHTACEKQELILQLNHLLSNPVFEAGMDQVVALGEPRVMEAVLIAGHLQNHQLGRILLWSGEEGFSSHTMDLVRVLAPTLSQRLVDYNRERTHLSQFFSADTIDEGMPAASR